MRFLLVSFWAALKEQRKSLRTWIFALLLPFLTGLLVWQLQPANAGGAVRNCQKIKFQIPASPLAVCQEIKFRSVA